MTEDEPMRTRGVGRPKGVGGHRIWIALRLGHTAQEDKDFIEKHLDAIERRDALIAAAQVKQEKKSKPALPDSAQGSDHSAASATQK